jgi:hypothetical protein
MYHMLGPLAVVDVVGARSCRVSKGFGNSGFEKLRLWDSVLEVTLFMMIIIVTAAAVMNWSSESWGGGNKCNEDSREAHDCDNLIGIWFTWVRLSGFGFEEG